MLYNNLIYFLVVIFVFSTRTPATEPSLAPWLAIPLFVGGLYFFSVQAGRMYRRIPVGASNQYFAVEKQLSIAAVFLFILFVYVLDVKFYFRWLSFDNRLPVLENIAGLLLFFGLLTMIWLRARPVYQSLFQRSHGPWSFVLSNIKANLPIILPWLVLSAIFDLLLLLPFAVVQEVLNSPWGDLLLFAVFVCFLALFFPPLVKWLWGCTPMPEGPLKERILAFCKQQGFHSKVLMWPLFEGQVLTAGIMGIVPKLRYLLVTPALLATLNQEELDAVLAHEIGHVKKLHLVLYIFLFLGFSALAGSLAEPLPHFILSSDLFYTLLGWGNISPETLLGILGALPLLLLMLLYFRYIFGYFIRNFERQADLYVFKAQGTGRPLVGSFEKIACLSGNIRDEKNWHHFGIGERIDYIDYCEQDRKRIGQHDRKVYLSLAVYFLCVTLLVFMVQQFDSVQLSSGYELKYTEAILLQKSRQEPGNSLWPVLLGDLMQRNRMERKAVTAYEKALALTPMNAEVNNNLAWLLLTAGDKTVRDPRRALTLARTAVTIKEQGYVLDTLALAFWANGFIEEALQAEAKAVVLDPENRRYYESQVEKFNSTRWGS